MLDPEVNLRKFELELERVRREKALLESRGCFLIAASYPNLDVLVLPELPLAVQFLEMQPGQVVLTRPRLAEHPIQSVTSRPFICRFGLDDFDLRPPSLTFLHATTRKPLTAFEVPRGHLNNAGKFELVVLDQHPTTKRPFLCVRGIREYHEHPQHTGDDWFLYRGSIGVLHLLDVVWRTCVKASVPLLRVVPEGIQFMWGYPQKGS